MCGRLIKNITEFCKRHYHTKWGLMGRETKQSSPEVNGLLDSYVHIIDDGLAVCVVVISRCEGERPESGRLTVTYHQRENGVLEK